MDTKHYSYVASHLTTSNPSTLQTGTDSYEPASDDLQPHAAIEDAPQQETTTHGVVDSDEDPRGHSLDQTHHATANPETRFTIRHAVRRKNVTDINALTRGHWGGRLATLSSVLSHFVLGASGQVSEHGTVLSTIHDLTHGLTRTRGKDKTTTVIVFGEKAGQKACFVIQGTDDTRHVINKIYKRVTAIYAVLAYSDGSVPCLALANFQCAPKSITFVSVLDFGALRCLGTPLDLPPVDSPKLFLSFMIVIQEEVAETEETELSKIDFDYSSEQATEAQTRTADWINTLPLEARDDGEACASVDDALEDRHNPGKSDKSARVDISRPSLLPKSPQASSRPRGCWKCRLVRKKCNKPPDGESCSIWQLLGAKSTAESPVKDLKEQVLAPSVDDVPPDDSLPEADDASIADAKPSVENQSKPEIVKDSNGECALLAYPILPTEVHYHLVLHADEIYSILSTRGIAADKVTLSAGFDEDIIRLNDASPAGEFAAQRAFVSCSEELKLTADNVDRLLTELRTSLAPFSGILETPTQHFCLAPFRGGQGLSPSHCRHLNVTSLSDGPCTPTSVALSSETSGGGESSGDGDDTDMAPNGFNGGANHSGGRSEEGNDSDDDDSDDNAGDSEETVAGSDKSGGEGSGDPGSPTPLGVGVTEPYAAFDIKFKVKPFPSCQDKHYLRLKGTLESKELATQYNTSPDTISTSRVRFRKLEFHRTCSISDGRKESYQQFYARVDVEASRKCPIYLNNVYPKSTQRVFDGKSKVTEAKEHTRGHQFTGSAKLNLSWIPFLATVSPSVSVSTTQTHKAVSAKERTENGARIEQVDTSRGLRWGYHVDDDWTRQNGLRLSDAPTRLPTAQFDFLGREAGRRCPKKLHVTVRSYWSLSPASEPVSFLGGRANANRDIHFRNIGVQVTMTLPLNLTKTWHVHRDVNAWVGRDCKSKLGGQMKDTYLYGDHGVPEMGTPFYALNERDCMAPDILAS